MIIKAAVATKKEAIIKVDTKKIIKAKEVILAAVVEDIPEEDMEVVAEVAIASLTPTRRIINCA